MSEVELVKAKPLAKVTGLNRYFIYKLAASGRIPCYRAGRAIRFSIPEVLSWMKDQQLIRGNGRGSRHEE